MIVCMGVGRNFSRGGTSVFFQKFFLREAKSGEIWFLPIEIKKTANFQIPSPLPTPICLCVGKVRATPLKTPF